MRAAPSVLVLTDEGSPTVEAICVNLRARDVDVMVVSTQRLPSFGGLACEQNGPVLLEAAGTTMDLVGCSGILDWHAERPAAPDADPQVAAYVEQEWRLALRALASVTSPSIWLNHPRHSSWLESNKLEQMRLAELAGIAVPPTLLSNNPAEIVRFCQRWEFVAVKSQGGVRIQESEHSFRTTYTQRCTAAELARAPGLSRAPMLIQPYLAKAYELRVTVVDGSFFCCKIDSQASERSEVDWRRYDFARVRHTLVDLEPELARSLRRLMSMAGLRYAAMDLLVTPEGTTYFLDLNPSGQFGWIEDLTGAPITASLCDALVPAGDQPSRHVRAGVGLDAG